MLAPPPTLDMYVGSGSEEAISDERVSLIAERFDAATLAARLLVGLGAADVAGSSDVVRGAACMALGFALRRRREAPGRWLGVAAVAVGVLAPVRAAWAARATLTPGDAFVAALRLGCAFAAFRMLAAGRRLRQLDELRRVIRDKRRTDGASDDAALARSFAAAARKARTGA